jgi:cell division protein FtsW
MAVVIMASFVAVIFLAGFPWKLLALGGAAAVVGAAALIAAKPYRVARLKAFLDPFSQAQAGGYQVVQSLIAFSNGGVLGTGVGAGSRSCSTSPRCTPTTSSP